MVSEVVFSADLRDSAPGLGPSRPCGEEGWEASGCGGVFTRNSPSYHAKRLPGVSGSIKLCSCFISLYC